MGNMCNILEYVWYIGGLCKKYMQMWVRTKCWKASIGYIGGVYGWEDL